MSGMKPMSSMRSASSSTKISTCRESTFFCCMWSSRRPGVATRMSTPRRRASICGLMLTPPKTTGERQRRVLAVASDAFLDLRRELARRREDQRADARAGASTRRRGGQTLQHRQREAGGLAGAGLRAGEQVAARQDDRDALRLDRRGLGVTLLRDAAQQRGREAERIEGHGLNAPAIGPARSFAPATVSGSIGSGLRPWPEGPGCCKRRPSASQAAEYTKPFGSKRGRRGS